MNASRMAVLFLAGAMGAAPAWGAEAVRSLASASGVTAVPVDKCPMHEMRQEAMHKPGEPCPFDSHKGGMADECKTHTKKDCLEKAGEPCPWPKHKGKMPEACDPAKRSETSAK